MNKFKSKTNKIKFVFSLIFLIVFLFLGITSVAETNARYLFKASGNNTIPIAKWSFKVNGETVESININLASTISKDNKFSTTKVIPGSSGVIPLEIDCSDSDVALRYILSISSEVPGNLKFYKDAEYTEEFTGFENTVSLTGNRVFSHNVYWIWEYSEDDETEEWANKEISIAFNIAVKQMIEGDV
ncbi:MAG: hypothetical protein Q4F33_03075 [Mycoplasmatota bacterium]|nr:hypothetical protein [Mycoplasmatota bacterium]